MTEDREIIRELAGMVATELGSWTVDTSPVFAEYRGVYLDHADHCGARLFLAGDWSEKDRLEISGIYPQNLVYDLQHFKIGVNRLRGPEVIAKEIRRRLLPDYFRQLARVQESNDDTAAMREKRADYLSQLAQTAPAVVSPDADQGDLATQSTFRLKLSDGYGDGRINYRADSVSLDLRGVTPAQALRIMRILSGEEEEGTP